MKRELTFFTLKIGVGFTFWRKTGDLGMKPSTCQVRSREKDHESNKMDTSVKKICGYSILRALVLIPEIRTLRSAFNNRNTRYLCKFWGWKVNDPDFQHTIVLVKRVVGRAYVPAERCKLFDAPGYNFFQLRVCISYLLIFACTKMYWKKLFIILVRGSVVCLVSFWLK